MFKNQTILITGGRAPATLHLVRLLKAQNNTILLAESRKSALSKASNCVSRFYLTPSPRQTPEDFTDALMTIIKKHHVTVLIPTCEETFYVAQYKEALSKYCIVYTMGIDLLNQLHNKSTAPVLLDHLKIKGLHLPITCILPKEKSYLLQYIGHNPASHYILKPAYSRFGNNVQLLNHQQLLTIDLSLYQKETYILQEFIEGQEICITTECFKGKLQSYAAYLTSITASRTNLFFKHYDNLHIQKKVARIAESLDYTGFLSFDAILSSDNKFYLIECNPRLTSGIHLFSVSDIIETSCTLASTNSSPSTPNLQRQMSLKLALISSLYSHPLRRVKALLTTKDIIFDSKDLKPSLYQFWSYAILVYDALKNHMPIVDIMTYDIEFNEDDLS